MFFYVGVESSLDGWLSSVASREPGIRHLWAALPSTFWFSILVGRLLATLALRRCSASTLLGTCLALSFIGTVMLLSAGQGAAMLGATAIAGLGLAPLFPLAVSRYAESVKNRKAAGLVFSAGGLGGAAVPAIVGVTSEALGSLRAAMSVALILISAMFILWTISMRSRQPVRRVAEIDNSLES